MNKHVVQQQLRVSGLDPAGMALLVAQSHHPLLRSIPTWSTQPRDFGLVIAATTEVAEQIADALRFFLGSAGNIQDFGGEAAARPKVLTFLSPEVLPFEALSPAAVVVASRMSTLALLREGGPAVVVTTPEALLQRLIAPERFDELLLKVTRTPSTPWSHLVKGLERCGYLQSSVVEEVGQFAARGSVVDFYPPGSNYPIRVEYFGDNIRSLRTFEASTQRSVAEIHSATIIPAREWFLGLKSEPGAELDGMISVLRARTADLGLPASLAKQVEDALRNSLPLPGIEQLQPLMLEHPTPLWGYFQSPPSVYVYDEPAVAAAADEFAALVDERETKALQDGRIFPHPKQAFFSSDVLVSELRNHTAIYFDPVRLYRAPTESDPDESGSENSPEVSARTLEIFSLGKLHSELQISRRQDRPFQPLADEIRDSLSSGFQVVLVISHPSRLRRLEELLRGYDIQCESVDEPFPEWLTRQHELPRRAVVFLVVGNLRSGLRARKHRLLLIPDVEVFPDLASRKEGTSAKSVRRFLGSLSQLKEGDYIVHLEHGIGIYLGLRQVAVEGKISDFLFLEYAEGAKLYIPVESIGKVQKYAGADAKRPALSRLGGNSWNTTKSKVRENVAELAGQLLQVLAEREVAEGVSFGPFSSEDAAFADRFPYDETPDQAQAIQDSLADLNRGRPMDRLVCGDVGYGKTEVALRAAYKVASTGKQVAVLVPTTVLADQHYETFQARFSETPVRVGMVSRFQSPAENKATLAALAEGQLEVIIGTHRLLQRDVLFADLGLVIIDEEHRFGVAHKERLKRLRANVHVLTLTATPIPRTLHMSLVGIRDLSIIETAPANRQVIRTYLANYSDSIVREALQREIGRNGQVFYIHNRVNNIALVADEVAELLPQARVEFAHGQMKDGELEKIMHRFQHGEIDVLVSTTIVESGLDIPNANTIIIRDADQFGLAELYQLRGRVGRSSRRAYAYLLIPDLRSLGSDAKKRLQVLQSLDDLGIGFRLALQDMEIRGAGNLLGKDQSGHINLVGFELYSRILKEVVEELRSRDERGERPSSEEVLVTDPEMKIGFPAHIPPDYIPDVGERLLLYQRLIELRDEAEGVSLIEEIEDRFGSMGEEVLGLVQLMVFRSFLKKAGVTLATLRGNDLTLAFHPKVVFDPGRIITLVAQSSGRLRLSPSGALTIAIEPGQVQSPNDLLEVLKDVLVELSHLPIQKSSNMGAQ